MYQLLERPVRRRVVLRNDGALVRTYAIGTASILCLAISALFTRGYPSRLTSEALRYAEMANDTDPNYRECKGQGSSPCRIGSKGVPAK